MDTPPSISSYLPDLVNNYISLRAQRLDLDRQVEVIKASEEELKRTIIDKMREGELKALGATNGMVKLHKSEEPVATDWPALYEHIKETGSFEFLHKRIATVAIKEHWEAGEVIPGVGKTDVYKLTVSKV